MERVPSAETTYEFDLLEKPSMDGEFTRENISRGSLALTEPQVVSLILLSRGEALGSIRNQLGLVGKREAEKMDKFLARLQKKVEIRCFTDWQSLREKLGLCDYLELRRQRKDLKEESFVSPYSLAVLGEALNRAISEDSLAIKMPHELTSRGDVALDKAAQYLKIALSDTYNSHYGTHDDLVGFALLASGLTSEAAKSWMEVSGVAWNKDNIRELCRKVGLTYARNPLYPRLGNRLGLIQGYNVVSLKIERPAGKEIPDMRTPVSKHLESVARKASLSDVLPLGGGCPGYPLGMGSYRSAD